VILRVERIDTFYGLSQALFGVSLAVEPGEIVCLLGRNGVGKTTTLRSIMGLTPPRSGHILFKGAVISGKAPYEIARLGVGFVPEDRRIFPALTVWENLDVGMKRGKEPGGWTLADVYELFPRLEGLRNRKGGYLSGGEQQMLTIARTLMGNPELLLLDEPTEGLSPLLVRELGRQIQRLKTRGITVLLAEQNASFALTLSERVYLLEKGQVRFTGSSQELRADHSLRKTLLGV
jgi:branched-chain amino acid transport system ATP-binding protein